MSPQTSLGNILIIDDDQTVTDLLRLNLQSEGYNVVVREQTSDVLPEDVIHAQLILIDAAKQDPSGIEFIERLKHTATGHSKGVILYSSFDSERSLIQALDAGADDSIGKPFSLRVMMARIRAVMRRRGITSAPARESNIFTLGSLRVDLERRHATIDNEFVNLSNTEFAILEMLVRNADTYTSRIEIFRQIWKDSDKANERIVDTNISRLRSKLGALGGCIVNRTGLGYMLSTKNPTANADAV